MKGQEEKTLAASGRKTYDRTQRDHFFPCFSSGQRNELPAGRSHERGDAPGGECAILPGAARAWRFVMAYKAA